MNTKSTCSLLALMAATFPLAGSAASSDLAAEARAERPALVKQFPDAFASVTDDPKLPRVLLIGDSISLGYTPAVRALLKNAASVHRIPDNGGPTTRGLAMIDEWLGSDRWDVVHFNFGLHDIARVRAGERRNSPDDYEKNLRALVTRLKASGAKLIVATTTPVPDADVRPVRKNSDVLACNDAAKNIATELGVALDDLYAVAYARLAEIQRPANVHFTPEGYRSLAAAVAASIRAQLPTAGDKSPAHSNNPYAMPPLRSPILVAASVSEWSNDHGGSGFSPRPAGVCPLAGHQAPPTAGPSIRGCALLPFALAVGAFLLPLHGETTHLFAFDDHTLPYKRNLKLTFATPEKFPGNPVVAPGPAGSVDAAACSFYGSIIRVGGKFRLWYSAKSDGLISTGNITPSARLAYAESDDGIHWTKPDLGLTAFNGSKHNNLVGLPPQLDSAKNEPLACFVLHEPADPDPARRYKMAVYAVYYPTPAGRRAVGMPADNNPSSILPFFSADGLTWTLAIPAPKNPWFDETEVPFAVRNNFEIGGLYKFDGLYHVAGQELSPDVFQPDGSLVRRTMVTHWSGDFIHWSQDKSYSFQRYGYRSVRETFHEAHEPAAVWNRGDVLIALYGLWHGAVIVGERRMDLGFLTSNDGIHFREPVADHVFLPAGADHEWDARGLLHGQGFENVGDQTYLYYGSWDVSGATKRPGAIGLALLGRDRLASLSTRDPIGGEFTSRPLANPRPATLSLNADGLAENAFLRVELIDKAGAPVAGYSGASAALVKSSGFHTKVAWPGGDSIRCANAFIRVRITFAGAGAAQIKFFAGYLE